MISSFKTAQALVNKLDAFCTLKGLNIVVFGSTETLDTTQTYIKEHLLDNDEDSVGMSGASSDVEFPIYQIDILTPKNMTKWKNKEVSDLVKAEFKKAEFVLNDGEQSVQIQSTGKSSVIFDDTHAISSLSVNLTVIATNT